MALNRVLWSWKLLRRWWITGPLKYPTQHCYHDTLILPVTHGHLTTSRLFEGNNFKRREQERERERDRFLRQHTIWERSQQRRSAGHEGLILVVDAWLSWQQSMTDQLMQCSPLISGHLHVKSLGLRRGANCEAVGRGGAREGGVTCLWRNGRIFFFLLILQYGDVSANMFTCSVSSWLKIIHFKAPSAEREASWPQIAIWKHFKHDGW